MTAGNPMTNLEHVARVLLDLARAAPGQRQRHLFVDRTYGGLKVVIKLDGDLWQLGLWRQNACPSQTEIESARAAFGAPKSTVAYPKLAKNEKGETWKGAILSWHDPAGPVAQVKPVGRFIAR